MSTSTTQLWGRAWSLSVQYATPPSVEANAGPFNEFQQAGNAGGTGSSTEILSQGSWDPEALRVTFEILETVLPSPFWYADISVYNLNVPEIQNLLFNATNVTFSAGYQTGPNKSSVIWDGPVLQVLFDRENVVDFKITFHCIASLPLINDTLIQTSVGILSSQAQLVSRMVDQIGSGFQVNLSPNAMQMLQAKQYPRGKTLFGRANKYLEQMADDNGITWWQDGIKHHTANLSEFDAGNATPSDVLVYSPPNPPGYNPGPGAANVTQTIIGVPKQTPFGAIFTVLLDPRLIVQNPPMLAQLDKTVISQAKITYGQIQTPLDANLTLIVAQVRHYGDTRGNDWYTEVNGYTRTYAQGLLARLLATSVGST